MKTIFCAALLSICFMRAFSQTQQCPSIAFSYDEAGNRVQRSLTVVPCRLMGDSNGENAGESQISMQMNIYPNPAKNKIVIEFKNEEHTLESKILLYDINGKEIYAVTTSSLQVQIDFSSLSNGTYLLKIIRGTNYKTYNITKT